MRASNSALTLSTMLMICAGPGAAMAQTAYLQQSGIAGQGTTLNISRLPVASSMGTIRYYDTSIALVVSAAGVPSVVTAPTFRLSPTLVTSHFLDGRYFVKQDSAATQFGTLSYGVGSGGSTVWTLVMDKTPDGDFPMQAVWQTGSPAPDVAARLVAAKVPSNPNYTWGINVVSGYGFPAQGLVAAEQVNSNLVLNSYSTNGDRAASVASIILGLCANTACSNAPL